VPYLVLAQNPLLAERYVNHLLGSLLEADRKGRGSLVETLDAYLSRGSVKDAADALHLHRHTVLYRLDKIRDLVGGKIDDQSFRLRLQLALDLRRLL
jgi:purine catabolism regulator